MSSVSLRRSLFVYTAGLPIVLMAVWSLLVLPVIHICACVPHAQRQRGSQHLPNPPWNGFRPPDFHPYAVPDLPTLCRDCTYPMLMLCCWSGRWLVDQSVHHVDAPLIATRHAFIRFASRSFGGLVQ